MKQLFYILFFIGVTLQSFAQLDGSDTKKKTISTGILAEPLKNNENRTSLNFNDDSGFKNAHTKQQQKLQKQQKQQLAEDSEIITPEIQTKQNYDKNMEGFGFNFPMIDMDLGSFTTKSKNVFISSYDFGKYDGDRIAVYVNGKPHITNLTLIHQIKTIKIPLKIGINKIEVVAIDEGELSPNTGAFKFYDSLKNVFKQDNWFLAKGAKVITVVIREKDDKRK